MQLYTRGHLTFMQTRPETEEKMNQYENMRTLYNFIHLHKDVSQVAGPFDFVSHKQISRANRVLVVDVVQTRAS